MPRATLTAPRAAISQLSEDPVPKAVTSPDSIVMDAQTMKNWACFLVT